MLFNNLISNARREIFTTLDHSHSRRCRRGLPVGLLGGMFAELSGPAATEKSSGNGGSPHAMSAEFVSALDSVRAFAYAPASGASRAVHCEREARGGQLDFHRQR
ncbi:MAG: hypothetical protein IPP94_18755 [Ignavibacteria bacterium]|nr:hypothetical protein [Ignavibacteria bacterium]